MAVLPPIKRLVMEDYKSQQEWISPLLLNLNGFMDGTLNALNKSLTLSDNSTSDVKTVTLTTVPTKDAPVTIAWSKRSRPVGIQVINVTQSSGAAFTLSAAVQVQFSFVGPSTLLITNVVGITPTGTNPYILQLFVIAG